MRNRLYPSDYLALLTIKYDVDPDKFFNALIQAWKNRKAECEGLTIECRMKQQNKVIFLIMQNSSVVAQFKVPEEFLSRQKNPIRDVKEAFLAAKLAARKFRLPQSFQIKDLQIGMKRVTLQAKVVEVSKPTFVVTRFGNCASVANAMVQDNTGQIKLCLWNDQISSVAVGDTLQIENARISAFKNERQMRVGKKGVLRVAPLNSGG
jgi:replication factor A1